MRLKSTGVFLLMFFLLYGFGCATTPVKHNDTISILDSWLGKNWEYLLRNWYIPDKSFDPDEGGMIIEYIDRPVVTTDGVNHPTPEIQPGQKSSWLSGELKTNGHSINYEKGIAADAHIAHICKVRFFIERNGMVKKWQIIYD